MHNFQSFGDLKATARKSLEGNYGRAIMIYVNVEILSLIPAYVSFLFFSGSSIIQILFSEIVRIILLAFVQVLQLGVCLFYLKLNCGQPATTVDLFHGFRENRNQTLGIGLILTAISYLCFLPATLASYSATVNFYTYSLLELAGLLVSFLLLLPFQQCYYALLDFPGLSIREVLMRSVKLMRGNSVRYILLTLSFLPLLLLSLLCCGIGLLWVVPYMEATFAAFYLDLVRMQANS